MRTISWPQAVFRLSSECSLLEEKLYVSSSVVDLNVSETTLLFLTTNQLLFVSRNILQTFMKVSMSSIVFTNFYSFEDTNNLQFSNNEPSKTKSHLLEQNLKATINQIRKISMTEVAKVTIVSTVIHVFRILPNFYFILLILLS